MSDDREFSWRRVGPTGVSEADQKKNEGWSHRTQVARNAYSKRRERSISAEVEENRIGETISLDESERKNRHSFESDNNPESKSHGESNESDYEFGRPLTKKEKAARKFGKHWSNGKKRRFLTNDTDLDSEAFNWEL